MIRNTTSTFINCHSTRWVHQYYNNSCHNNYRNLSALFHRTSFLDWIIPSSFVTLSSFHFKNKQQHRRTLTTTTATTDILQNVQNGKLSIVEAEDLLREQQQQQQQNEKSNNSNKDNNDDDDKRLLKSFANIDHNRTIRTGFPEAVFAAGKSPQQVAMILDDMARNMNEEIQKLQRQQKQETPIIATRVTPSQYNEISKLHSNYGTRTYYETARILSMTASSLEMNNDDNESTKIGSSSSDNTTTTSTIDSDSTKQRFKQRIVVATAGTTDLFVAEEAAIVLELSGCIVDRVYDVGVAGLHRVLKALPKLQNHDVGCIIVCAGMDGALPSVIGGLVSCPVIAVPTSVGYGISLGGISAMLTMLNTCSPGVGVVNIDNGFGAAALAYKCINKPK